MGWLWASTSPKKRLPDQPPSKPDKDTTQSAAPNDPDDPEIQKFVNLFANDNPKAPESAPSPSTSWLSFRSSSKKSASPPAAPPGNALSESLLPTEMSCRQAFDLAWSCNSLGGRFNSVYRYGSMRSCSELWDDFWFCMRTKSYSGELKENAIRAHYRNKEQAKYGSGRPSSEDIWESREEKLQPGAAFAESIDPPEVDDGEWRKAELERRREIRQALGPDETS